MCRLYVLSAAYRYYIRDPAITTHLRIHMSDTHIRDTQQDTYIRILPHCEIHISDTHIRDTHNRILTFRFFRDTHIRDTHNRILAFGFFRTVEYIWVIPTSAIHTTRYLHSHCSALKNTYEWYPHPRYTQQDTCIWILHVSDTLNSFRFMNFCCCCWWLVRMLVVFYSLEILFHISIHRFMKFFLPGIMKKTVVLVMMWRVTLLQLNH